jgi:capsular polysaccharide export protein
MSHREAGCLTVKIVGVYTPTILDVPHLAEFLKPWGVPADIRRGVPAGGDLVAIAGWGLKPRTQRPRAEAAHREVPFLALEDGFLRSIRLGSRRTPAWSLIVDPDGLYYDPAMPSRLERLIAEAQPGETTAELIELIRTFNLSKYNDAPDLAPGTRLGRDGRPVVLVVDQSFGDWSVIHGGARPATLVAMLDAARDENPGAEIVLRVHPDMFTRTRRGHLVEVAQRRRVRIFAERASFGSIARAAAKIYTVTSLAGMEALTAGIPVVCFGKAFYAGWGLTDDRVTFERPRTARPRLEALVAAAYERYPRYVDPVTGESCDALALARRLAAARRHERATAGDAMVLGVSRWKRSFVRPFIATPRTAVAYRAVSREAVEAARRERRRLYVWASREPHWLGDEAARAGVPLTRIEDGFLRSVGLGSNFLPALSLVLDADGIYFDSSRGSGLERLLNDPAFPPPVLHEEAIRLASRLVERGLTKYNVRGDAPQALPDLSARKQRIILVPGQIEDDASIVHGSPAVKRNLDLMAAVRRAAPDAILLYKPHPEIEAGNRLGAVPVADALRHVDHVLTGWDTGAALALADEVHTMTSLLGFEALLRGIKVICHGLPFYAGLGLTIDMLPWPRPRRAVDLETLVAAVLLVYPRYRDPGSDLPVSAFDVLDILERQRGTAPPAREPIARAVRWLRLTANI